MTDPTRPSNLESVVAAAARTGDPSDPETLRRAADRLRGEARMIDDSDPIAIVRKAKEIREADARIEEARAAADARIEAASRALHEAHMAVADAANEWEADPDGAGSRTALCAAVRRWRAAGEAFVRATRGGS